MATYRKSEVWKPCWELKHCPYGMFVETMPLPWTDKERKEYEKQGFKETPQEFWQRAERTLLATPFDDVIRLCAASTTFVGRQIEMSPRRLTSTLA